MMSGTVTSPYTVMGLLARVTIGNLRPPMPELSPEDASDQHRQTCEHEDQTECRRTRTNRAQASSPLPHKIRGQRHDQESMRVVFVMNPVVNQAGDDTGIEPSARQHHEDEGPEVPTGRHSHIWFYSESARAASNPRGVLHSAMDVRRRKQARFSINSSKLTVSQ